MRREVPLNRRLTAVAAMVESGDKILDIGADHAYLAIYLTMNELVNSVVATDIAVGPINRARANIKKYDLEDKITTVQCSGTKGVPRELFNTCVICGMGCDVILSILENTEDINDLKWIIQPQTGEHTIRKYMLDRGFNISSEQAVVDRGKVYTVIKFEYTGKTISYDQLFLHTGRVYEGGGDASVYIEREIKRCKNKLRGAKHSGENEKTKSLEKLLDKLENLRGKLLT